MVTHTLKTNCSASPSPAMAQEDQVYPAMTQEDQVYTEDAAVGSTEKTALLHGDGLAVESRGSCCCSWRWQRFWVCTAALMAYSAAFIIYWPLTQQYVYHRVAINKFGNASAADSASAEGSNPCFANSSDPNFQLQQQAQAETSTIVMYLTLSSAIPATLVSLVLGSYSDQLGRRLLFLVPLVGNLLRGVLAACVIHYGLSVYILLAGNFVEGATGSFFVVILAGFAFTADITPPTRMRTVAMAALEAMYCFVGAFAQVGNGYLISYFGFLYSMLVSIGLVVLSVLIVVLAMKETVTVRHKTHGEQGGPALSPWTHLKKSLSFYYSGKSGKQRAQFGLCLLMFLLVSTCGIGRIVIEPLYQLNSPFCWHSVRIGIYGAARTVATQTLGTLVIKVLYVCMWDELIAFLSLVLATGSFVLEALATTDLMMYLVPAVGITSVTPLPIIRSIMSRMASPEEQGAVLSSVAAVETFCQSIASLLINVVYQSTLNVFPGTVFLVMGGLCVLAILLLGIFVAVSKRR